MPQINLLFSSAKKKVTLVASLPKEPKTELLQVLPAVGIRSAICVGICFIVWIFLFVNISKKNHYLSELEGKAQVLNTNPKEIEKITSERLILEKKASLIEQLSSRKFLWYEKLKFVASLIPDGVWLTDIYFKQEKVQRKDSDTAGKADANTTEKTILVIKGMAVAYKIQDAVSLIGDYIKALQTNQEFAKDFSEIKLNTVSKSTVGGLDVMRFDFLCEAK